MITTCSIDPIAMRGMNMKELHDLRDALHVIGEVLSGLSCQPRFEDEPGDRKGPAGVIEDLAEFLHRYEQAAINIARATKAGSSDEAEWRSWTLLGFEADIMEFQEAHQELPA